eukprot:TRINITY_DN18547_c0_g1_i2.p1 TRINITY_DN18547_c0_g1~~TRINITY_DN18547_c0_g1_i2.p1  ORF type:complete len:307 (-),score=29.79 TRINITY_DN18547_c0_g1_i2:142-1062(-)
MYGGGGDFGGDYGGGANQFGGGGFMPSTPAPATGPGAGGAFSPGGGAKRPSNSNTIFPVTIREISNALPRDATDNTLIINGHEVTNIVLLGKVTARQDQETHVGVTIDDGTGKVEVRQWVDESSDHATLETIKTNVYVRVHGHLRLQSGKKFVIAHAIRPVTDHNEVTFHFLDAIFVFMHTKKMQAGGGAQGMETSPQQPMAGQQQQGQQQFGNAYNQYVPSPGPAAAAAAGGGGGSRINEIRLMVQRFFEEPQNISVQRGIHYMTVTERLQGVSERDVREAIEFLVNEGLLYSTIDDDHFRSTAT